MAAGVQPGLGLPGPRGWSRVSETVKSAGMRPGGAGRGLCCRAPPEVGRVWSPRPRAEGAPGRWLLVLGLLCLKHAPFLAASLKSSDLVSGPIGSPCTAPVPSIKASQASRFSLRRDLRATLAPAQRRRVDLTKSFLPWPRLGDLRGFQASLAPSCPPHCLLQTHLGPGCRHRGQFATSDADDDYLSTHTEKQFYHFQIALFSSDRDA